MKFEIGRMKFVRATATEKFERAAEKLLLPGNKFDRAGLEFAVRAFGNWQLKERGLNWSRVGDQAH